MKGPGGVQIVKLGGSVITRKGQEERLRPKVLDRLAVEAAEGWEHGRHPLVLLHGAGSFGHPSAKAWGLAQPPPGRAHRERGAALTAYSVRRLHLRVLRALLDAGLPARSVPPYPTAQNHAGKLQRLPSSPFQEILLGGEVAVSFGDVVRDDAWGSSILSADTLALHLARELPAATVLFVSDVPGVLETDPHGRTRVLAELGEELPPGLKPKAGQADVTGGIRGKVETMQALARAGVRAGLISGLSHGNLSRALRGEHVHGTWTVPLGPRVVAAPQ
jgi:isopentenyl phosphate kinase